MNFTLSVDDSDYHGRQQHVLRVCTEVAHVTVDVRFWAVLESLIGFAFVSSATLLSSAWSENSRACLLALRTPFWIAKSFPPSMRNDKAPGLTEVRALKVASKVILGQLVQLFNECLRWGVFLTAWKVGYLRVFLKDEGKDKKDPKSYRPICLLSVIGKLFEKIIMSRLNWMPLAPKRISPRQFGFTQGKQTEDDR